MEQVIQAKWNKKNLKARTIFISTVSDKQLEYVGECKTTFDMITKFDKVYSTQSTALQIICRGKIEEVKMKNYNEVENFLLTSKRQSMISKQQVER